MNKKEFIEKYGDVTVKFSSYYKYTFTYSAEIEEGTLYADYGGNADEIYKLEVANDETLKLRDLYPYSARIYKDKKEICSFYDYQNVV